MGSCWAVTKQRKKVKLMTTNKFDLNKIMNATGCPEIVAESGGWEAAAQISAIENWLNKNPKTHITYVGNAFSLQMLTTPEALVSIVPADWDEIPVDAISCIGHADTAAVASQLAGREIPCQRISVILNPGDEIFVVQVTGGRLPEGCTTLPEGVTMTLKRVLVR